MHGRAMVFGVGLVVVLTTGSGCAQLSAPAAEGESQSQSKPEPAPTAIVEPEPEPAPQSKPEPAPQPKPEPAPDLFARVDLEGDPERIAQALARDWCELGGATFHPISDPHPDEFYPYTLESCDDVVVEHLDRQVQAQLNATLMRIDAGGGESRDLLLLQGQHGPALVELGHDFEDQSGEGGAYSSGYAGIELREVSGDDTPEWIATRETSMGGSFEADRCYNNAHEARALIVCSWRGTGFACFEKSYYSVRTSEPWSDLDECGVSPSELERVPASGYRFEAKLRKGKLQVSGKVLAEDLESEPIKAGSFPLDELFEAHAIPVGVFPNDDEEY